MIALRDNSHRFTPEEYFAWEEQQQIRHEYIDGEVYAMTGGTLNHSEIAGNLTFLFKAHLRGRGCRVLNSDGRVNIYDSDDYVYPDLTVSCDERDKSNTQFVKYPCLIVEVLSPTTEAYDRGDKFFMYRRAPSLQDYVLVSANKMAIDVFHRDNLAEPTLRERGNWDILNYRSGDIVELKSINLTFPIEEVFEGIIFE